MLKFIANNPSTVAKYFFPNEKVIVQFSVDKVTSFNYCVLIRLKDNRARLYKDSSFMLKGGASLHSLAVNKKRLYYCPFIDHFNGTYDVVCRLYDECHNVSITLNYLHYSAFKWDSKLIAQSLFSARVCRRHYAGLRHDFGPYTGWYRDNITASWRWVRGDREVMSDNQLRSCITQLPSPVLLFGDSHLRFTMYYWLHLINKLPVNLANTKLLLPRTFTIDKFRMQYSTFIVDDTNIPNLR